MLRWQALIALSSIILMFSVLAFLSRAITTTYVPEAGGTYVEGVPGQPGNLNPLFLQNSTDADLAALLFEPLLRVAVDGTILPNLATAWETSDDGLRYTLHLRNDVRWHDGEPFTAEDVAYTISVMQDPTYTANPAASDVWRTVRVEVVDALTLRFTLPQPFAPFLSFVTFMPIPQHLLAPYDVASLPAAPFSRAPVGTGRWQVADVSVNAIALTAFSDYFGPPPMLDSVTLRFYPSIPAIIQAYRRGEIIGIGRILPQHLEAVLQESQLQLQSATLGGLTMAILNQANPLFNDPAVRQALYYGLDRQALIQEVYGGQAIVAHSFLLPTNWAYNPGLRQYPYDPDRARELLGRAGWVDGGNGVRQRGGQPFQFVLVTNEEEPRQVQLGQAMARQWSALGLHVEAQAVNFGDLTSNYLRPRAFDVALVSITEMPIDPDPYPLFHSTQRGEDGGNLSNYESESADRLLVTGRRTLARESRREIYFDFQELFATDLPLLPLFHPVFNYAVDARVREVKIGPLSEPSDRFQTIADWYVKTRRITQPIESAPEPAVTP